jgi:hypothetical protein
MLRAETLLKQAFPESKPRLFPRRGPATGPGKAGLPQRSNSTKVIGCYHKWGMADFGLLAHHHQGSVRD